MGNDTAIDGNRAVFVPDPLVVAIAGFRKFVRAMAAVAVGQREAAGFLGADCRLVRRANNTVTVEVQSQVACHCHIIFSWQRHVLGQIVDACFRQAVIGRPRSKGGLLCAGMANSGAGIAAAEVVRMALLLHCGVCLLRPNRRGQQGQAERQGGEDAEKFSFHRVPSRKKVGWFLLQRNQGDIPFQKLCLKSDCECTYKISQTGPNGKKNFVTLLLFGKGRPALWAEGDGAWGVSVYELTVRSGHAMITYN